MCINHLWLALGAAISLGAAAMRFFSDNAAAAHPAVLEAIAASNRQSTAYDGDEWSAKLDTAFSDLFETQVRALWVTTGTAANCLALAALCPPFGGIVCHREAHIENDEAGAPGFYTNGAKLILVDGPGAVDHQRDRIWARLHRGGGWRAGRNCEAPRLACPHGRRPFRKRGGQNRRVGSRPDLARGR